MKQEFKKLILGGISIFLLLLLSYGCGKKLDKVVAPSVSETATYVGSETCGRCHQSIYDDFKLSGHPYKLRTRQDAEKSVENGLFDIKTPASAKFTNYTYTRGTQGNITISSWNDISYVIGGYKWKARFLDSQGYIITGSDIQYNLQNYTWGAYESGKEKKYTCSHCHNTGYDQDATNSLSGIKGTFQLTGIQCENCHGAGSRHVNYRESLTINKETSNCGRCHNRYWEEKDATAWEENPEEAVKDTSSFTILASTPFIKHHEQYEELLSSPHGSEMTCITCHNPHKRGPESIKVSCENCHNKYGTSFSKSDHKLTGMECKDCHMAKAGKSAISDNAVYNGDLWTHLFTIKIEDNPTVNSAANKNLTVSNLYEATDFIAVGATSVTVDANKKAYISWEYACKRCHKNATAADLVTLMNDTAGELHSLNDSTVLTNRAVWEPPTF